VCASPSLSLSPRAGSLARNGIDDDTQAKLQSEHPTIKFEF